MQNKKRLKYSIIIFLILFAGGWFFVSPSFRGGKNLAKQSNFQKDRSFYKEQVSVKGAEAKQEEKSANITFENLLVGQPDAPQKKEGFGDFYDRSKASIAIDAETGTILHYHNAREKRSIASLTKVMTAIVVLEEVEDLKKEIVTIDKEALSQIGTRVGCPGSGHCVSNRLQLGEEISACNLFQAMVMNSTNDAAVALGNHIAGSQEEFAHLMNKKAQEMGLKDTHFCNASGLDDDDNPGACYSTAYDIARISAYSLQYDEIWDTMKIKEKDVYSADGQIKHRIVNTDMLIEEMSNCLGGKTGFTYEAGKSLMTSAHHPADKDKKVIGVVLDNNYRWEDMKKLLKWSFQAYEWPDSDS
ncbi:MAG: D-alanyl-D-alanine carboxypeptidase family protein [Patescibacteria group bacterium]